MPINIETPIGEEGKHGLFAFVYNKERIIYIGKALESMHLYQESKGRYKPLRRAFEKLGLLPNDSNNTEIAKIEEKFCVKYLAELHKHNDIEEDKMKLEDAEKLLIYSLKPEGNVQHKKKYIGRVPVKLVNKGPIIDEFLCNSYEIK
jgi:hypothetical protein